MDVAVSVVLLCCLSLTAVTRSAAHFRRRVDDGFVRRRDLERRRDLFTRRHSDVTGHAAVDDLEIWINDLPQPHVERPVSCRSRRLYLVPILAEILTERGDDEQHENPEA